MSVGHTSLGIYAEHALRIHRGMLHTADTLRVHAYARWSVTHYASAYAYLPLVAHYVGTRYRIYVGSYVGYAGLRMRYSVYATLPQNILCTQDVCYYMGCSIPDDLSGDTLLHNITSRSGV